MTTVNDNLRRFVAKSPLAGLCYDLSERLFLLKGLRRGTFSQHGEDRFILDYFNGKPGTYIDVGANYPIKISNTYLLYRSGWCGITIEPIPRLHFRHKRIRPKDIQLGIAVSDTCTRLIFYELHPSSLSSFDEEKVEDAIKRFGARIKAKVPVVVKTLAEVVEQHAAGRQIDLLTIDAEGLDLRVLRGLDWSKTKPALIVCEHDDRESQGDACNFLKGHGYRLLRTMGCNDIFVK